MGLDGATVWEVRTGGSDTNGGGYVATGTDYSLFDAAELTLTNVTCTGDTTLTDADDGGEFTDAMIGNILYLSDGKWYQIMSRTDADNIVIDQNGPTDTGMTLNVGGALATPGGLGAVLAAHGVSGNKAYIKSGTYPLSVAGANVPNGSLSLSVGNMATDSDCYIECYQTTREDLGTPPKYLCSVVPTNGYAVYLKGTTGEPHTIVNMHIDGGSVGVIGIRCANTYDSNMINCLAENCTDGFYGGQAYHCESKNNSHYGFYGVNASLCWAHGNGSNGFNYALALSNCISSDNTNEGFYNTRLGVINCISYNNSKDGFRSSTQDLIYINCIAADNGEHEYQLRPSCKLMNCASKVGASGRSTGGVADFNPIVLTADPFIDVANGDFRLNNVAGGGLLCRAAGLGVYGQPGTMNVGAVLVEEKKRRLQMRVIQ